MIKNVTYFFIFLIFISGFSIVKANNLELLGKVIYIDPGHGGADPGAVYDGVYESELNLEIALELKKQLEEYGAIVYLTRDGDYDLSVTNTDNRKRSDLFQRVNLINDSKADIYYSLHLNAIESSSWFGAQVFYSDNLEENKIIAECLQEMFSSELKTDRSNKEINDVYMYQRVEIPGVLIELGFLSNSNERYLLQQKHYHEKLAEIIKKFTIDYLE